MLSCMETDQGLMIIGPNNVPLRLSAKSANFLVARDLLRKEMPAEQAWQKLMTLIENPLLALITWCERYGIVLKDEPSPDGDLLRLDGYKLSKSKWLPFLNRVQAVSGTPSTVLELVSKFGDNCTNVDASGLTLHKPHYGFNQALGIISVMKLPVDCRKGDLVDMASKGSKPFLVSFDSFSANVAGEVSLTSGQVLGELTGKALEDDILNQPVVTGFDGTYRCEEGSAEGWCADLSFDSLRAAEINLSEMKRTNPEVRIINVTSGEVVRL